MLQVIAPSSDGAPRRGCEDAHCSAARGILEQEHYSLAIQHDLYAIASASGSDAKRQPPRFGIFSSFYAPACSLKYCIKMFIHLG